MFGFWNSASAEADRSSGMIEMKGTKPSAVHSRLQWRGIWPWEEPSSSSGAAGQTLSSAPKNNAGPRAILPAMTPSSSNSVATIEQPTIVDAAIRHSDGILQCVPSAMQRRWSGGVHEAEPVNPPEQPGCTPADDGDYYELRVTVKVPKSAVNPADQHNAVDELRQELARVQVEHQKALRALHTKGKECEDLLALVRELTESRSQLTAFKAIQGERFEDLQQECLRLVRVAELCRAVSKENLVKSTETTKKLNQKEEELARQRLIAQQTDERLASQKLINLELKERLNMLERLDYLTFRRESACLVKFQQLHLKETY